MENLPWDIVLDIFLRVPLKSVIQSCCVSKTWYKMIKDPSFANRHQSQSNTGPSQMILTNRAFGKNNVTSISLVKYEFHKQCALGVKHRTSGQLFANEPPINHIVSSLSWNFVGTCNGLICFSSFDKDEEIIMVCNPLIRDFIFLPKPSTIQPLDSYTSMLAFGFDLATRRYKVVRILLPQKPNISKRGKSNRKIISSNDTFMEVRAEVYTLGCNNSWKEVEADDRYVPNGKPVYANGCLHWLVQNQDPKILSFELDNEIFKVTPHPQCGNKIGLRALRGCLCLIDLSSLHIAEIWMLKDYKSCVWEVECCIPLNHPGNVVNEHIRTRIKPENDPGRLVSIHEVNGLIVILLKDSLRAFDKTRFHAEDQFIAEFPKFLDWEICGGYRRSLVTLRDLGDVKNEKKGVVKFVSEEELESHLLLNGGCLSRQKKKPSDACTHIVTSFQRHGLL